jgi:excisionase family DNA binding protein
MQIQDAHEVHNLNPDPLLSVKEAAKYLRVSLSTMYEIAEREKFPVIKVTSDRKIRKSVLDDYIKRCEQPWCRASNNSTN